MSVDLSVFAFYRFTPLPDFESLREPLLQEAVKIGLSGTLLLASEGINGTLCGTRIAICDYLAALARIAGLQELQGRWSGASKPPFQRMRVKLRNEIVTLGRPDLNPADQTGTHVDAAEWNRLLEQPDVLVIDTRNTYEIEVGTFPGAVNPATTNFREFPEFVDQHADTLRKRPVAMFCTGGIRCEKASALLKEIGCQDVYQLDGGILGYLETINDEENRWQGECFVFDSRVAVDEDLAPGNYVQCHACRRPLGADDLASPEYEEGISCPACYGQINAEKMAGLRMRRRQSVLRQRAGKSAK